MSAERVVVDFERLLFMARTFEQEQQRIQRVQERITAVLARLKHGGWEGEAADTFMLQCQAEVLPAIQRLSNGLALAAETTRAIHRLFGQAEEEAAAYLRIPAEDAVNARTRGNSPSPTMKPISGDLDKPALVSWRRAPIVAAQADEPKPDTAAERSAAYTQWTAQLQTLLGTLANGIRFYNAAARVTRLLSIADDQAALLNIYDLNLELFAGVPALNDFIGEGLYNLNSGLYGLLNGGQLTLPNGHLVSPQNDPTVFERLAAGYTVSATGELIAPNGVPTGEHVNTVTTPLDWDLAMVWREQLEVEALLIQYAGDQSAAGRFGEYIRALDGVNLLLNLGDDPVTRTAGEALFGADFEAIDWAERALRDAGVMEATGNIAFANLDHRAAIGIATIFQEHGQSEAEFAAYIQHLASMSTTDQLFGAGSAGPVFVPPAVADVAGIDYTVPPESAP